MQNYFLWDTAARLSNRSWKEEQKLAITQELTPLRWPFRGWNDQLQCLWGVILTLGSSVRAEHWVMVIYLANWSFFEFLCHSSREVLKRDNSCVIKMCDIKLNVLSWSSETLLILIKITFCNYLDQFMCIYSYENFLFRSHWLTN